MPGRGAALENLDDDHASAAAWARVREGRLQPSSCQLGRQLPTYPCPKEGARNAGRDRILRYVRI